MEVACQTDPQAMAALLPVNYPANLVYAQSMLAMSISQRQIIETQKMMLRMLLREKTEHDNMQAVLNDSGVLRVVGSVAGVSGPCDIAGLVQAAAAAAGNVEGAGAPAGGRAEAANADQPPVERWRTVSSALKVALVMILLEVRALWFIVYFFATFLYIGGMFDPAIAWFMRHRTQGSLEQQLNQLRSQQQRATAPPPAPAAVAAAAEPIPAENPDVPDSVPVVQTSDHTGQSAVSSQGGDAIPQELNSPTAAPESLAPTVTPATNEHAVGDAGADAATGAGEAQRAAPDGPPHNQRFFYQLVVMFFMTLIPWWTPDPRYL